MYYSIHLADLAPFRTTQRKKQRKICLLNSDQLRSLLMCRDRALLSVGLTILVRWQNGYAALVPAGCQMCCPDERLLLAAFLTACY